MEAPRLGIKFYVLHLLILHGKLIRIAPLPTLEHLYETAYSAPLKPDIFTTRTDCKMKRSTGRWERGPSESSRNRTDARQKRCPAFPALFPLPSPLLQASPRRIHKLLKHFSNKYKTACTTQLRGTRQRRHCQRS